MTPPPKHPRKPSESRSRPRPSGRASRPAAPAPASPNGSPPEEPAAAPSPSSSPDSAAAELPRRARPNPLLLADSGPAFNPKRAPDAPAVELPEDAKGLFEEWDEARIREALELQGETMHAFFNGGPADADTWLHTEKDLRAIAPPLTRILNRYDATRAAAAAGDEILLAAAVTRYGTRNYIKRRRYIAQAREEEEDQPRTGAPAPEGTGPEVDQEWQRTHPDQAAEDPLGGPPALNPRRR